jgi:hypothetical protein
MGSRRTSAYEPRYLPRTVVEVRPCYGFNGKRAHFSSAPDPKFLPLPLRQWLSFKVQQVQRAAECRWCAKCAPNRETMQGEIYISTATRCINAAKYRFDAVT